MVYQPFSTLAEVVSHGVQDVICLGFVGGHFSSKMLASDLHDSSRSIGADLENGVMS